MGRLIQKREEKFVTHYFSSTFICFLVIEATYTHYRDFDNTDMKTSKEEKKSLFQFSHPKANFTSDSPCLITSFQLLTYFSASLYRKYPQKRCPFCLWNSFSPFFWAQSNHIYTTLWTVGIQVTSDLLSSKSNDQTSGRVWHIWILGHHSLVSLHPPILLAACSCLFNIYIFLHLSYLKTSAQFRIPSHSFVWPCLAHGSKYQILIFS